MIVNGSALAVFEDFQTDRRLPKFRGEDEDGVGVVQRGVLVSNGVVSVNGWGGPVVVRSRLATRSWWRRLFEKRPTLSVEEFFAALKNTTEELAVVRERAAGYEASILHAEQAGQTALAERLRHNLLAVRSEAQLFAMGLTKYVSEETVVKFVKESPRGLRLDWVANFTRPIPEPLLATKKAADERGIFDNYVVLHYDPEAKAWAETAAERARRRDPILFGVMEGRRVLYFIGDWVDEFCDLTLDQLADKVGAGAIQSLT